MIDYRHQVARMVQKAINVAAGGFPGLSQVPRVIPEAVEMFDEEDGGRWFLVPVEVHRDYQQMSSLYRIMADVETGLEDTAEVSILISPRVIPFRSYEDVAS